MVFGTDMSATEDIFVTDVSDSSICRSDDLNTTEDVSATEDIFSDKVSRLVEMLVKNGTENEFAKDLSWKDVESEEGFSRISLDNEEQSTRDVLTGEVVALIEMFATIGRSVGGDMSKEDCTSVPGPLSEMSASFSKPYSSLVVLAVSLFLCSNIFSFTSLANLSEIIKCL